jgi:cation diffusion facilitator family transporter
VDYGTINPKLPFGTASSSPFRRSVSLQHTGLINFSGQSSEDRKDSVTRLGNLHEMRPFRLVGMSLPLCDWTKSIKTTEQLAKVKNHKVREFYEKQNQLIAEFCAVDKILDSGIPVSMLRVYGDDLYTVCEARESDDTQQDEEEEPASSESSTVSQSFRARQGVPGNIDEEVYPLLGYDAEKHSGVVMLAIYVNFAVNVVLLAGKVVVAVLTNSLSVLASLVDSVLDFLSTLIIWLSTRLVDQRDWRTKIDYPVGRSRLEPIGVLVFSILIIVSFLKVGNEALERLIDGFGLWPGRGTGQTPDIVEIGVPAFIIMSLTVVVKVFCYLWCRTIKSSAIQALAQDSLTDIVFNLFSMIFPVAGHWMGAWWMDSLGALFLSCYIVYSWGHTALEHIGNLTGSAASPEERQTILYLCMRFSETIKQVTTLNAYHIGDRIMVEVDVILTDGLSLRDSHDLGEALQYALETLPFVERAFVHLDYRLGNFTGHIER